MKIEVVRLFKMEYGHVKALADLQFENDFIIKAFKLIDGKEGLFVGMPSEVNKNGRWYNTFIPLSNDVKQHIQEVIIQAYAE